jgi:hypothetical protein
MARRRAEMVSIQNSSWLQDLLNFTYIEKCCQSPNLGFAAGKGVVERRQDQLVGELEE